MNQASISLRRATASDVPALTALVDEAYAPYVKRGIALPDVSGGLADDIAERTVLVAEADEILGVLVLNLSGVTAHLMNIAVAAQAQGRGVGKLLIQEAETMSRASGATTLDLATHKDIPENVATYEHLGWQVTGREAARILMSKPLT